MRAKWTAPKGRWLMRAILGLLTISSCFFCLLICKRPAFLMVKLKGCDNFSNGVISADSRGRLGNNLAEYATIYALGIRYNVTALATRSLLRTMAAIFPYTSLPVVDEYCAQSHEPVLVDKFEAMSDEEKKSGKWKIDYYPHRIRLFWYYREALLKEFKFRQDLVEHTARRLQQVAAGRQHLTFVGVHIRRTDYAKHLRVVFGGRLVNESFYHSALNLCRRRYHQPVFIVTSDDLEWCRKHLSAPDVHILGDPRGVSPGVERDLALLAACNHTVFDYGTYGFFAAFLAGGDVTLADGYSEKEPEIVEEFREGKISATFLDGNGQLLAKCVHCS